MEKHIYYVRHGECELNLLKVFAGQSESPLTELGRQQAVLAARDILQKKLSIDKVVASSLWRAQETAQIIAREIGYPETEISYDNVLMERSFGMMEGSPRSEFFDAYSYQDIDNIPRAETVEMLHKRASHAVEWIKSLDADNILVVSHSAFYRAFRHELHNETFDHEYSSPFLTIKNGQVYTLA